MLHGKFFFPFSLNRVSYMGNCSFSNLCTQISMLFLQKHLRKLSCQKKNMHFKIWHEVIDNKLDRLILTILSWSKTKQPSSNNQRHLTSVSFVKICYNQQHGHANYFCTFVLLLWPIGTQFIVSKGIFNGYPFKQEMIILFCFLWNDNKF